MQRCDGDPAIEKKRGKVKLPFGRSLADGRMRHVLEVENGSDCGCVCPECATPLIAHQGDLRQAHFAHHPDYDRKCVGARQTALHLLAKDVIEARKGVMVPDLVARFGDETRIAIPGKWVDLDEAVSERRTGDIQPDIVARKLHRGEWKELLVEVAVTHFCGREKIARIRELGIACFEIDLSKTPRHATRAEIEDYVVTAPRKWLFNPRQAKADADLKDEVEREQAAAHAQAERKLLQLQAKTRRDAERIAHLYMQATEIGPGKPTIGDERAVGRIKDGELSAYVGLKVRGQGCFSVAAEVWQSIVVDQFVLRQSQTYGIGFHLMAVLEFARDRGLMLPEFKGYIPSERADAVRLVDPDFASPYEAIDEWLGIVTEKGLLQRTAKRWLPSHDIALKARDKIKRLADGRDRVRSLEDRIKRLLAEMPTGQSVDPRQWMATVLPSLGKSPLQFAMVNASSWISGQLDDLSRMLKVDEYVVEDLLGLPLERVREARRRQKIDAEEERRRAAAEKAARDAEDARQAAAMRKQSLVDLARFWCDVGKAALWLATPQRCLNGVSPDSLDGLSEGQLEAARGQLQWEHRETDRIRTRDAEIRGLRAELRTEAVGYRGEVWADNWMKLPNSDLGGRPVDICVSEAGLARCQVALRKARWKSKR